MKIKVKSKSFLHPSFYFFQFMVRRYRTNRFINMLDKYINEAVTETQFSLEDILRALPNWNKNED